MTFEKLETSAADFHFNFHFRRKIRSQGEILLSQQIGRIKSVASMYCIYLLLMLRDEPVAVVFFTQLATKLHRKLVEYYLPKILMLRRKDKLTMKL